MVAGFFVRQTIKRDVKICLANQIRRFAKNSGNCKTGILSLASSKWPEWPALSNIPDPWNEFKVMRQARSFSPQDTSRTDPAEGDG
jgi:hypothetical protein